MSVFFSKETIDTVINGVDIVSVINEYTKLESKGNGDFWGCCPFHGEKTASFHVDVEKKFYHCFGCGVGGNVIKFIEEQEKLPFPDAVEFLAKKFGIPIKSENSYDSKPNQEVKLREEFIELYERTASMFHYLLTETQQGKSALKYIMDRGLTEETIRKFKLGYAPADRQWLKSFLLKKNFTKDFLEKSGLFSKKYKDVAFFSNRLMFPIFNRQGQVVAFGGRQLDNNPNSPKYLNSGDLIQYKKGETLYAFNFAKKSIRENHKVIFCEGYMDCIAYHQCGIEFAVAPLGTSLTDEQIKIIRPFVDEVLLSFDADGAGQKATLRAILMLRKAGIVSKVIKIEGGKDPAELMQNFGKKILTNAVSSAILDSDFLLSKLGKEYPIDTPEGKTRAALAYFPYLDALQSDILRESCLTQLCERFNLKMEAVKKDFFNREEARKSLENRQPKNNSNQQKIKLNAELRSLLAVVANLENFTLMRTELSCDDFENPIAKKLFIMLEECYKENSLSFSTLLSHCDDENISNMITNVISIGEFKDNTESAVNDSIKLLKARSLERQRKKLLEQIKKVNSLSEIDKVEFEKLFQKKVELDNKIKSLMN